MDVKMDRIHIQTFGKFEIICGGQVVRLERSDSTKTAHLLQFLMTHQGKAFEKSDLVRVLYEDGEVGDPLNNLKVNVFRLRQMLEKSGLPGDKFILHKKGCYSWNKDVPLELDLDQYRRLLDHAARSDLPMADRAALMMAAIDLYGGEFLPGLRNEPWVAEIDAECQQRYLEAVVFVADFYRQTDDFERERAILRRAAEYFPCEGKLRELQLQGLIEHKMFREAMNLYDEITSRMLHETGTAPSDSLMQLHELLVGEMDTPVTTFADVRRDICEKVSGAFGCSYPAFIEMSRLAVESMRRCELGGYFVLCTLVNAAGSPPPAGSRLREAACAAGRLLGGALRRGDLYTRCGSCQFLILMTGASREDCSMLSRKIDGEFAQDAAFPDLGFLWEFEPVSALIPLQGQNASD